MPKKKSKYGVRYSVLLSLPYFDPIWFSAIDTMHKLYFGTGKHAFMVWVSKKEKLGGIDLVVLRYQLVLAGCQLI